MSLLTGEGTDLRVVWQNDNSHLKTPEFLAGEKSVRRAFALEPGLWFRSLEGPELQSRLSQWSEARPSDGAPLSLEGLLGEEPVGLLQLEPVTGRIILVYLRPEYRRRGFGIQLLGQAVQYTRKQGGEVLSAALAPQAPGEAFFRNGGFVPQGQTAQGQILWQKSIGFDPLV